MNAACTDGDNMKGENAAPLQPPLLLTRHETACLQSALALVIVRRRLAERNQKRKQQQTAESDTTTANKNKKIQLIQNISSDLLQQQPLLQLNSFGAGQSNENWASHLSLMMQVALQEVAKDNSITNNNSLRLESLATHLACQLVSWSQMYSGAETTTTNEPLDSTAVVLHQRSPTQDWIHGQLTAGTTTETQATTGERFRIWHLMVRAQPVVLAALLIPVLLQLLHDDFGNANGHVWNLLELAVMVEQQQQQQASPELVQETIQALTLLSNTSPAVCGRIDDLAYYFQSTKRGSALLLRWACADLVQRLLAQMTLHHQLP